MRPRQGKPTEQRRAIGVVRVSRVGGRKGETFVSEREQQQRIEDACSHDGLDLSQVFVEENVSGGAPLARRSGLRPAVELIEAGKAEVLVVAYFDRLVRKVTVLAEVLERVEKAGGRILAVDAGEVRADTASRWLSSTMQGAIAEYYRLATVERTAEAKRLAVARGVPPFPQIPPGFRLNSHRQLEPHPQEAPVVAEAFRLRADGATIDAVRKHLRTHGIERSLGGVRAMLRSRLYIGELHFGDLVNKNESRAIVDRVTFERVQRMRVSGGRRPVSDRLLARLGVLRCGTCGQVMVVSSQAYRGGRYYHYRCCSYSAGHECPRPVTISAELVEAAVVRETQALLAGLTGRATLSDELDSVRSELAAAEQRLDRAVRAFGDLDDVDAAREQLAELRSQRDALRDRLAEMEAAIGPALTITASADWDKLSSDERRALIRAVIQRVEVASGRAADRITIHPIAE